MEKANEDLKLTQGSCRGFMAQIVRIRPAAIYLSEGCLGISLANGQCSALPLWVPYPEARLNSIDLQMRGTCGF